VIKEHELSVRVGRVKEDGNLRSAKVEVSASFMSVATRSSNGETHPAIVEDRFLAVELELFNQRLEGTP